MSRQEFEHLVSNAVASLPENIRNRMNNVALCVDYEPTEEQLKKTGVRRGDWLLGLYEGIPTTTYGRDLSVHLPDKITIFQKSIGQFAQTEEEIENLVQQVVRHEIAHHFGFDEKDARRIEKRKSRR
jgi:predicted Zn-dependent protease with MMP-like domain